MAGKKKKHKIKTKAKPGSESVKLAPFQQELSQANQFFNANQTDQAGSLCRSILEQDPDNTMALFLIACIHQRKQQFEQAINVYDRILTLNASMPAVYMNRANIKVNLGLHQQAISDFRQALTFAPVMQQAYIGLGDLYRGLGSFDKMAQIYRDALKAIPQSPLFLSKLDRSVVPCFVL